VSNVFTNARSVYEQRATLGLVPFKDAPIPDEPAFAVTMEICGVEMDSWNSSEGMETAIGIEGEYSINLLTGKARFKKTAPTLILIHLNVDRQNGTTYNREVSGASYSKTVDFVLSMSK
jgi:hypothetical protein